MDNTTLLMSKGNPSGAKLEELLQTVIDDLKFKNSLLDLNDSVSSVIHGNNTMIISSLDSCIGIQSHTMTYVTGVKEDPVENDDEFEEFVGDGPE